MIFFLAKPHLPLCLVRAPTHPFHNQIMIIGEAIISDLLTSALSNSTFMTGVDCNLPHSWTHKNVYAYLALAITLSFLPLMVVSNLPTNLCFTTSERWNEGTEEWELPALGDYMMTGCPRPRGLPPWGPGKPGDLYPNATAGAREWG